MRTSAPFAVVPPRSKDKILGNFSSLPREADISIPAAGPDSSKRTGNFRAVTGANIPPLDVIIYKCPLKPKDPSSRSSFCKYLSAIGLV